MSKKWKVFATDTYDYDQWQIGKYDTAEEAQTIAINKAGEMLRTDVEGPNGKRIGSYQGKQTTPPPLIEQLRATVVEQSQEIGRLRNDLRDWAECASVSVTMEGPRLMGWNPSALNRCLAKYEALQPKEGS